MFGDGHAIVLQEERQPTNDKDRSDDEQEQRTSLHLCSLSFFAAIGATALAGLRLVVGKSSTCDVAVVLLVDVEVVATASSVLRVNETTST